MDKRRCLLHFLSHKPASDFLGRRFAALFEKTSLRLAFEKVNNVVYASVIDAEDWGDE